MTDVTFGRCDFCPRKAIYWSPVVVARKPGQKKARACGRHFVHAFKVYYLRSMYGYRGGSYAKRYYR